MNSNKKPHVMQEEACIILKKIMRLTTPPDIVNYPNIPPVIANIILLYYYSERYVFEITDLTGNPAGIWDHQTYDDNTIKIVMTRNTLKNVLSEMHNMLPRHVAIIKQYFALTINIICCAANAVNIDLQNWDLLFGSNTPQLLVDMGDKYSLLIADRALLGCSIAPQVIDMTTLYSTPVEVRGTKALNDTTIQGAIPAVLQILKTADPEFTIIIGRMSQTIALQIPPDAKMINDYEFKWTIGDITFDGYVLLTDVVSNKCIMYILVRPSGGYTILFGAHFCELTSVNQNTINNLVSSTIASNNLNIDTLTLSQIDLRNVVVTELRRTRSDNGGQNTCVMNNMRSAIQRALTEGADVHKN